MSTEPDYLMLMMITRGGAPHVFPIYPRNDAKSLDGVLDLNSTRDDEKRGGKLKFLFVLIGFSWE